MPTIEIKNLDKSYTKNRFAVRNLHLTIEQGEIWALVGPNGAGKTTTLHCLTGLFKPDSGKIHIFGKSPQDALARGKLGFQSEIFYTYPYLTTQQVLSFYLELHGILKQESNERIENILQVVGLAEVKDHKTSSFSKGMMQRLGIAQSLIHEPELIIWDEPTSGLDPEGRKLVLDLLIEMKSKGKTVLFSTHILSDIEKVCDHIAIINQGEIMVAESIETLMARFPQKSLEDIYLHYMHGVKNA